MTSQPETAALCPHCPARTASTDSLTGLVDRRGFHERLERLAADPGEGFAVLLLDLDRFKQVNDALGHPIGDALLRKVAERLRTVLRPHDVAGRLGGDEFGVLLAGATAEVADGVGRRLVQALAQPYLIQGQVAVVGASAGIALAPQDGTLPETLLTRADLALYQAKGSGRGRHSFFVPELQARAEARRALEIALRADVPRGELELYYQAQFALPPDSAAPVLAGFEALLRWNRPGIGQVSPAEFIPLAEEIGAITALGAWALREATRQAMAWPAPLVVAVNVSPRQFEDGRLPATVRAALLASGLPGPRLEIEVTETALLRDAGWNTLEQLLEIKRLGVHVSLDDFGTGYSSLTQLRSFPFDRVKIDRSFADDAAVVQAVAALGRRLGMRTTVEGVESEAQLARLREDGCMEVQGFLLGRPTPAARLDTLLQQHAGTGRRQDGTAR